MSTERRDGRRRGMTRRKALLLAGAGAVSVGVGAAGLLRGWGSPTSTVSGSPGAVPTGDRFVEPTVIASEGGRLQVTLTAAAGRVTIAGRSVQAMSYNGSVPGPTLRLRPGDRVTLDLVNRLGASTNLHTHGLHVSAERNGDNPFLHIRDGETFRYEYEIPRDHPAGTFWYHPHLHGTVADQLFAGLMGAIVVQRDDSVPLPAQRERVLVITDTTLDGDRIARANQRDRMLGREGELVLVNGRLKPTMTVSPGGYEHWHIINACTSRFMRLRLEGAELLQVAGDTGRLATPTQVDNILLATGNRAELLVRIPGPGRHQLVAEPVDRGGMGMGLGRGNAGSDTPVTLLEVEAAGQAVPTPQLPGRLVEPEDLRAVAVNGRRTLTFAMGMGRGMGGGVSFTIDGKEFDPDRVDTSVRLDTVEEWTIRNTSPMNHPFHLHVWPVQLVARDGSPVEGDPQWYDVVILPARSSVTVRLRLTDFPGRTVYHCHILDHEDLGMMGVVEATR
ncbi:MAG: multicopper oxidase family protein [Micromonospora sp.]